MCNDWYVITDVQWLICYNWCTMIDMLYPDVQWLRCYTQMYNDWDVIPRCTMIDMLYPDVQWLICYNVPAAAPSISCIVSLSSDLAFNIPSLYL